MTAGPPHIGGTSASRTPAIVGAVVLFSVSAFTAIAYMQQNATGLMPRGMCFLWNPNLIWSNVVADAVIACSYVAIAAGLIHLVLQNKRQLPFHWMFVAFALFILTCAATHVLDVVTLWLPAYWASTALKFLAACASAITAFTVPLVVLRVTATLSRAQLVEEYELESQRAKDALERQTIGRALHLARANSELERAIAERTHGYDSMPSPNAGYDGKPRAALRLDALPIDAGVALAKPSDESDELARIEALIELAQANAMLKASVAEQHADPAEPALLQAREEIARSLRQLERRLATCARADDDAARFEAITELARMNGELEDRLAERTIDLERINLTLARQLRDIERAYDDLESYASALGAHEQQQRMHAQQLRALHAIASATTAEGDDQIEDALRLGLKLLDLDWAYLGIIDRAAGELVVENSMGRDDELVVERGVRLKLAETIFGAAIATDSRAVVIVEDVGKLQKPPLYNGWSSYIAVPLRIAGIPYGVIGFTSRERRDQPFSQANVEFLSVASELISSAIERRIKNAQLATSERRYRALTEAMPQLMWVVDAAGQLEFVNESWSEYTGYTLEESRTLGLARFYERSDMTVVDAHSPAAGFECEARLRRFDGVYRWHLIRSVPFAGTAVLAGKSIVTATDIEERKLSETLTAAAHAAALAATESKSRFLATMSHEIRTPMNGIVGMTELLLLTPLADEQREYAQVVRDSGQSLLRVLNDILDYSKIEAGKIDIESVEFDLPGQVESVVELLGLQFRAKGVGLTTQLDAELPRIVLGDPGRVRQILLNLAGNALKFTPAGGSVEIIGAAGLLTDGKTPVRFIVKDTGIGIPPDSVARLFQPFTQGDASTTRQYGGTGLGLSISAQLVALMGGTIGVQSTPGAGSAFWFEIPFVQQHARRAAQPALGSDALPAESLVARHEKILVVDDNAVNALLAQKQFKRLGFDITCASSGRECIGLLEREHFDLVFMDCQMPELDGFETTREIRLLENGFAERVPIVAMTADARAEDRQRCLDAGMDDYLSKPTKLLSLKAVIDRWLPAVERRLNQRTPTPPDNRKPALGVAMLLDLFEGDSGGVRDLLEAAARSIRADVARIERAAVGGDRKVLVEAAHRLKGTSGSIRSVRLVDLGAAIQAAAATDPCVIAPAVLIALREALRSLDEDIRTFNAQTHSLTAER